MTEKITIPVEFEIGSLEEIGYVGFKQQWVSAERDGIKYEVSSGAGLGNAHLEGSATRGSEHVYAKADITPLASALWDALTAELPEATS